MVDTPAEQAEAPQEPVELYLVHVPAKPDQTPRIIVVMPHNNRAVHFKMDPRTGCAHLTSDQIIGFINSERAAEMSQMAENPSDQPFDPEWAVPWQRGAGPRAMDLLGLTRRLEELDQDKTPEGLEEFETALRENKDIIFGALRTLSAES